MTRGGDAPGAAAGEAGVRGGGAAGEAAVRSGGAAGEAGVRSGGAAGEAGVRSGGAAGEPGVCSGGAAGEAGVRGGGAAGEAGVRGGGAAGEAGVRGGDAAGARFARVLRGSPPFDAARAIAFLSYRAVPGVEDVEPYRRALRLTHGAGVATLEPVEDGVAVSLDLDDARDEAEALAQLAFVLDLDAPAAEIAAVLGRDERLGFTPGLRVPGGDGVEIAVRAVLTQQISVKAGRTHAGRLVVAAGEPLARPRGSITHLFPTAEAIAAAPDSAFAMPARRRETLRSLAGADLHDLTAIAGIGPWTQAYVNMRALRDRDAWLGTDLVVRKALGPLDPEAWRPYRAYAVVHLWNLAGGG